MADYPDWTLTNTVASQSLVLFDNNPGVNLPIAEQIDVSLYESVDIGLTYVGTIPATPVTVYVQWLIGTIVVAEDVCTVWAGLSDSFGAGNTISLPARGDTCFVRVLSNQAGSGARLTITGSTRSLEVPRYGGTYRQIPGLLAGGVALAFTGNQDVVTEFGPVSGPITVAFINGTQILDYNVTCWGVNSAGVPIKAQIAAGAVAAAANLTIGPLYIPNMALSIEVLNASAAAAVFNYAVTGGQ